MVPDITPSVKFIGVDDLDLDLFESQYVVPEGMSYNSYVILDEKTAVLDTADGRKGDAWKANLAEALGEVPEIREYRTLLKEIFEQGEDDG